MSQEGRESASDECAAHALSNDTGPTLWRARCAERPNVKPLPRRALRSRNQSSQTWVEAKEVFTHSDQHRKRPLGGLKL